MYIAMYVSICLIFRSLSFTAQFVFMKILFNIHCLNNYQKYYSSATLDNLQCIIMCHTFMYVCITLTPQIKGMPEPIYHIIMFSN